MTRVRVLVVEDSLTVRRRICDVLASDPGIEVVGEAEDGRTAVEACERLRPDVMTLDMMLPVMNGLEVTEQVMAHFPTPILVVSSSVNRGELFRTYDALAAGAIDVLEKPTGDGPDGEWERQLVDTVRLVARIRVITHPRAKLSARPAIARGGGLAAASRTRVVAIGASTGGPGAVVEILRALPRGYALPVLVLVHLGAPFAAAFADWLGGQSKVPVRYVRGGEILTAARGEVLLAPPGRHLVVREGRLAFTDEPERHSCRPSIDVLFESLARETGATCTAVLLTGMGRDGAAGLLAVRRAGGTTIAQDESTSVVYGMPLAAVQLDAAEHVMPIGEIATALAAMGGAS